jgi:hypothetical protein
MGQEKFRRFGVNRRHNLGKCFKNQSELEDACRIPEPNFGFITIMSFSEYGGDTKPLQKSEGFRANTSRVKPSRCWRDSKPLATQGLESSGFVGLG